MYDVVVLIEQEMSDQDAAAVVGLRDQTDGTTSYFVLLPVDDAASRVEASLGTFSPAEPFGAAPMMLPDIDLDEVRHEIVDASREALAKSVERLRRAGAHADGDVTTLDPVDALSRAVTEHQAAEVNVLTRPHLVSEFFHVDWSSKARRQLGVPTLHLIETGVDDNDPDPPHQAPPPEAWTPLE